MIIFTKYSIFSFLKKVLVILSFFILFFQQNGYGWDLDKFKSDTSSWMKEQSGKASEYIERKKEEVSVQSRQKSEELGSKIRDWSERTKGSMQERTRQLGENIKTKVNNYVEVHGPEIRSRIERASENFKDYISEPENQKKIIQKIREINSSKQEIEIGVIKIIPVYDPSDGQIKTFDSLMREMVNETSGLQGSALAQDPVRTGYLMCFGDDYLLNSAIIPGPSGQWLSINEATNSGYKTKEVETIRDEYSAMKSAYCDNDAVSLNRHLKTFSEKVEKMQPQRFRRPRENLFFPFLGIALFILGILLLGMKRGAPDCRRIVICTGCGLENPSNARYCKKCGIKFEFCRSCSFQISSNAKFCKKCGADIIKNFTHMAPEIPLLCPQCKVSISQNSHFCKQCGFKLKGD